MGPWSPGRGVCTPGSEFKDGDLRLSRKMGKQGVGDGDSPHVPGGRDLKRSTTGGGVGRTLVKGTRQGQE